jgi:hypothetical protein
LAWAQYLGVASNWPRRDIDRQYRPIPCEQSQKNQESRACDHRIMRTRMDSTTSHTALHDAPGQLHEVTLFHASCLVSVR